MIDMSYLGTYIIRFFRYFVSINVSKQVFRICITLLSDTFIRPCVFFKMYHQYGIQYFHLLGFKRYKRIREKCLNFHETNICYKMCAFFCFHYENSLGIKKTFVHEHKVLKWKEDERAFYDNPFTWKRLNCKKTIPSFKG